LSGSISLSILGHEYKVKAKGNESYLLDLSKYINQKLDEVQRSGNAATTKELIALVMLTMADEKAHLKTDLDSLKQDVGGRISKLIEKIDERLG